MASLAHQNSGMEYKDHRNLGLNPFKIHTNRSDSNSKRVLKASSRSRPRSYRVPNRQNLVHPHPKISDLNFLGTTENPDDSLVIFRNENNISELNSKIKNLKFKKGLKLRKPKVVNICNLKKVKSVNHNHLGFNAKRHSNVSNGNKSLNSQKSNFSDNQVQKYDKLSRLAINRANIKPELNASRFEPKRFEYNLMCQNYISRGSSANHVNRDNRSSNNRNPDSPFMVDLTSILKPDPSKTPSTKQIAVKNRVGVIRCSANLPLSVNHNNQSSKAMNHGEREGNLTATDIPEFTLGPTVFNKNQNQPIRATKAVKHKNGPDLNTISYDDILIDEPQQNFRQISTKHSHRLKTLENENSKA